MMLAREKWQAATIRVLERVFDERVRQVARYGHNDDLEDGTGPEAAWLEPIAYYPARLIEKDFRAEYEHHEEQTGKPTWMHLIREEIAEAFQEDDPERLAEELVQMVALGVSWLETLEKRHA
jgi:hypothetical protein